jgi:hypothetical protein
MEVGEEVHRRSLDKNFSTDTRQRLIEEECGSWRRKPSKVTPLKFLNRCASNIDRRRIWKLAKKSIEDRSTSKTFINRCASKIDRRRMWQLAQKSIEDRSTNNNQ